MNIRESILTRVALDLVSLQQEHGYQLKYWKKVKGLLSCAENYPTICYDIGGESSSSGGEVTYQQIKNTKLLFRIFLSDHKEKGKIIDIRERAISDINKFVMQDISIEDYDTINWKVLRLDLVKSNGQFGNGKISDWDIQIDPITDYDDGKCVIDVTVNIMYYDFHQSLIPEFN